MGPAEGTKLPGMEKSHARPLRHPVPSKVHSEQLFLAQIAFHEIRHDPGSDPMTSPEPGWKMSSEFQYKMEISWNPCDIHRGT